MKIRKALCLALAVVMAAACVTLLRPGVSASAANNPTVTVIVDGTIMNFPDVPAQIVNNRTLVPVRGVAEQMDPLADVQWDANMVNSKTGNAGRVQVMLPMNGSYVILYIGDSYLTYGTYHLEKSSDGTQIPVIDNNQKTFTMDTPAIIISGRTMIPASAVFGVALGATVGWDGNTYTVTITSPGKTPPSAPASPSPTPGPGPGAGTGATPTPAPSALVTVPPIATPSAGPFVTGASFEEISGATAQSMYDANAPFILYYYSSLDAASVTAVDWLKSAAAKYSLKVYGVDIDSQYYNNSGNQLTFIWKYGLSNYIASIPTVFFVMNQQDVSSITRPINQAVVSDAMSAYWTALSASPYAPIQSAPPSNLDLSAHWINISLQNAVDMYNNCGTFIYVTYNSADPVSNAYTSVIQLAAANAGVDVYVTDFAGMSAGVSWWGRTAVGANGLIFPTVFAVKSGNGTISDRVNYVIRPGDVNNLTIQFQNFIK